MQQRGVLGTDQRKAGSAMSMKNAASRATNRKTDSLRILMADDDRQEHLLMVMAAENASTPLIFDFVPDGGQLLTELYVPTSIEQLPNAIILDLRMPGFDGAHTLKELQQHPMFWQIPVVVFSSSARRKDEMMAYERGAVLFETKPSSFSEMEQFLERVIGVSKPATEYIGEASPAHDVSSQGTSSSSIDLTDSARS